MKRIHTIKIDKLQTVEEIETSINDKNEEVQIKKKVEKKVPHTFFIKRPTRSLFDDAEIYYSKVTSFLIKEGVISVNQLQKRFINDGGILSEPEQKEYQELYQSALDIQIKLTNLNKKEEKEQIEQEKIDIKVYQEQFIKILSQIQKFDNNKNALFAHTAEVIARNKTVLWWTLMLSYKEEDGKETPFFGNGSFEEKMKLYDKIEENEDPFEYEVIKKLLLIVNIWYFSGAEKPEEFDTLIKLQESSDLFKTASNSNLIDKKE